MLLPIPWNAEKWRVRFFSLWSGQAISLFGSQLVQFALIWWLTDETGSATVLATASLFAFLPQVLLGPFAGTLVDRWSRRTTMLVADAGIALATIVLAYLFAKDLVTLHWIYALLFVRSIGGGFHYPSMLAATSLMVPRDQLTRVQGMNQMLQGALAIFSAPVGAIAVELMTTQSILMIDVVTAAFSILPLLVMRIPETSAKLNGQGQVETAPFWEDFKAGFRYIAAWPGLLMVILLAVLLNFLLTPTTSLEPLLVTKHYGGGAIELGWLKSAFGAGMLAGGILLSAWGGFKKRIVTSLVGISLMGLFFMLLGLFPGNLFMGAVAAAFLAAVMLPLVNGPLHAVLQVSVDPEMQGRVFTLVGSMASAMAPLGLLIAGPVADVLGVRAWYVIAGVVCSLTGITGFFLPAVMGLEDNRRSVPGEEKARPIEADVTVTSV